MSVGSNNFCYFTKVYCLEVHYNTDAGKGGYLIVFFWLRHFKLREKKSFSEPLSRRFHSSIYCRVKNTKKKKKLDRAYFLLNKCIKTLTSLYLRD